MANRGINPLEDDGSNSGPDGEVLTPYTDDPTPTKGAFVDTITNQRLNFQYNPKEIKESFQSGWVKQPVPGSTHPRLVWTKGGGQGISFKLQFYKEDTDVNFVKNQVRFLQSFMVGDYGRDRQQLRAPAHPALFLFGSLYNLIVVVDKCDARFFDLFDKASLLPKLAEVDLVLEVKRDLSLDYRDLRPGGDGGFDG